MKENSFEKWAPLGFPYKKEITFWCVGLIGAILWSLTFISDYLNRRSFLFEKRGNREVLIEGAMMPSFEQLSDMSFDVFYLLLICCVFFIVYHVFYHYQGSKMMYLMRRLPNRWEVVTRCVMIPLMASVVITVCCLVTRMIYYGIYVFFTPAQCLPL